MNKFIFTITLILSSQLAATSQALGRSNLACYSLFAESQATATYNFNRKNLLQIVASGSERQWDLISGWRNSEIKRHLIAFFEKGIFKNSPRLSEKFVDEVSKLISQGKTESEVFRGLRKFLSAYADVYSSSYKSDNDQRVRNKVEEIKSLLGDWKPNQYLDVGTGTGEVAAGIGKFIGISPQNIFGVDVAQYGVSSDLTYLRYEDDGHIPVKSNSVDLITLFMVLHHIEDPTLVLNEIRRTISSDGLFVIRETDASTPEIAAFNEIADKMFYNVFDFNQDVPTPNQYRTKEAVRSLVESFGFHLVKTVKLDKSNSPFAPVYFVFKPRLY